MSFWTGSFCTSTDCFFFIICLYWANTVKSSVFKMCISADLSISDVVIPHCGVTTFPLVEISLHLSLFLVLQWISLHHTHWSFLRTDGLCENTLGIIIIIPPACSAPICRLHGQPSSQSVDAPETSPLRLPPYSSRAGDDTEVCVCVCLICAIPQHICVGAAEWMHMCVPPHV